MIPETKKTFPSIVLMLLFIICLCFVAEFIEGNETENDMTSKSISEVLKEHTDELMSIQGVVGTAQGLYKNKPCIKVLVAKDTQEIRNSIPHEIDGYLVVIQESGEIQALNEIDD